MEKIVQLLQLVSWFACCSFGLDDWDQFRIVWQDEFDLLNLSNWQHDVSAWGGGNNEFQLYTPDSANSFVRDGVLHIKPSLLIDNTNPKTGQPYGEMFMQTGVMDVTDLYGKCTHSENNGCYRTGAANNIPPAMSARLTSYDRFSFAFGRVVIRAKIPVGDWMWPEIWMMPRHWKYGDWPRSGLVSIIMSLSNRNLRDESGEMLGIQKVSSGLEWGVNWDQTRYDMTSFKRYDNDNNYGDAFHTFIFDWSPNGMRFFIDDENSSLLDVPSPPVDQNPDWIDFWEYGKPWSGDVTNPWVNGTNLAPFDEEFHFILNVAVGTTNNDIIPDGCVNHDGVPQYQKPWSNTDSYETAMDKFYNSRDNWKWTWDSEGDNAALQLDFIRVYEKILL